MLPREIRPTICKNIEYPIKNVIDGFVSAFIMRNIERSIEDIIYQENVIPFRDLIYLCLKVPDEEDYEN